MPMADWLHKYPQVQALLQQDGDTLDYAPDGDVMAQVEGAMRDCVEEVERLRLVTLECGGSGRALLAELVAALDK